MAIVPPRYAICSEDTEDNQIFSTARPATSARCRPIRQLLPRELPSQIGSMSGDLIPTLGGNCATGHRTGHLRGSASPTKPFADQFTTSFVSHLSRA